MPAPRAPNGLTESPYPPTIRGRRSAAASEQISSLAETSEPRHQTCAACRHGGIVPAHELSKCWTTTLSLAPGTNSNSGAHPRCSPLDAPGDAEESPWLSLLRSTTVVATCRRGCRSTPNEQCVRQIGPPDEGSGAQGRWVRACPRIHHRPVGVDGGRLVPVPRASHRDGLANVGRDQTRVLEPDRGSAIIRAKSNA